MCQPGQTLAASKDVCVDLLPGSYSGVRSDVAPRLLQCSPGFVDHDSDPSTLCRPCDPGSFQPAVNQTACLPHSTCPPGTAVLAGR